MTHNKGYYRYVRDKAIARKLRILRKYSFAGHDSVLSWTGGQIGRLSKNKIHCSCWLCRRKSYDELSIHDKKANIAAAQELIEVFK